MTAEALAFIHQFGSLLQVGGADPSLVALLQDLSDSTWFVIDRSAQAVQMLRGARPGESIADLICVVLFAKVTKEVRTEISQSPCRMRFPLASNGILSAQLGTDASTDDAEALYADKNMHGFVAPAPVPFSWLAQSTSLRN